jgi:hypothetical protein
MEEICNLCMINPDYHSFNHISKYDNNSYLFYTKITVAKDDEDDEDVDALLKHYENYLKFVNPDKWKWIINFNGFTLKHLLKINLTIKLGYLIQKYNNLERIIIFNSNYIVMNLMNTLKPFLGSNLFSKIDFYNEEEKNKFILDNKLKLL